MKILIVEDDRTSQKILEKFLTPFGQCDLASDGNEALDLFKAALGNCRRYDLVCLDIMMPKADGHKVLREIRNLEIEKGLSEKDGAKIIMTSALDDTNNVISSFKEGCQGYIVKPIDRERLLNEISKLGLIQQEQ